MSFATNFKKSILLFALIVLFLTSFFITAIPQNALASTPKIDDYITITSVSATGDGGFKIRYTVKEEQASSSESLYIGFSYPSEYRISDVKQKIDWDEGTHTMYLGEDSYITSWADVFVEYDAYSYEEEDNIGTYFTYPTQTTTSYHEVTSAEVYGQTIIDYLPGAILTYYPAGKYAKYVSTAGKTYLGWTFAEDLYERLSHSSAPSLQVGNYWKTKSYFSSSGYLKIYRYLYDTEDAYDDGDTPIYSDSWELDDFAKP